MNTPFDANSTGFDRVLDGTRIDTNKTTGQINIAVVPASTLETAVKISGGSTTATLDADNIKLEADTTPPGQPTSLSALAVSSTQILLTWSAPADTDIMYYKVYQAGTGIATVTSTVYIVPGLTASTQYSFTVKAFDAAGNFSAASSSASTTSGTTATASDFVGTWKGTMTFTTTNVDTSGSFPAEFVFALSNGLLTGTTIAYGDSATSTSFGDITITNGTMTFKVLNSSTASDCVNYWDVTSTATLSSSLTSMNVSSSGYFCSPAHTLSTALGTLTKQ